MSKKQRLWEVIGTDIADAIDIVLARHAEEISRQKKSAHLLAFWIHEGAGIATRRMHQRRK